jgi:uncharacterized LabA/DUF88 family protein
MVRVAVFIDGSNFFFACRDSLGRTDIDLGKFAKWLIGPNREHVRTYYYNCPLPADSPPDMIRKQQKFYGALARIPYFEVRLGKLSKKEVHCSACGKTAERYVEKGVDMRIGVDMLSLASKSLIDVPILVSGDADLVEAVKAVKELGKHVELGTLPRGRSWELVQAADVVHELDEPKMRPFYMRP